MIQAQPDQLDWQERGRAERRRHSMIMLGMSGGFVMVMVMVAFIIFILVSWPDLALTRACNQQVATLLNSHDLVEVQRAGILVRALHCDVVNRMLTRL